MTIRLQSGDSLSDEDATTLVKGIPPACQEFCFQIEDPKAVAAAKEAAEKKASKAPKSGLGAIKEEEEKAQTDKKEDDRGTQSMYHLGEAGSRALLDGAAGALSCTKVNLTGLTELKLSCADAFMAFNAASKLETLVKLELVRCGLTGELPPSISSCKALTVLDLSKNDLSGRIPFAIGALEQLTTLCLSENRFSGPIPNAIVGKTIQELYLNTNQLTGNIPDAISRCAALTKLVLHTNLLSGNLPSDLPPSLTKLAVFRNKLTGEIPESIGNCTDLVSFIAYNNQLSGVIPESIGKCKRLQYLGLYQNKLSGDVPTEAIAKLTGMKKLGLHGNDGLILSSQGKKEIDAALVGAKKWLPKVTKTAATSRMSRAPLSRMSKAPRASSNKKPGGTERGGATPSKSARMSKAPTPGRTPGKSARVSLFRRASTAGKSESERPQKMFGFLEWVGGSGAATSSASATSTV